jgi:condensin complex subunit 1
MISHLTKCTDKDRPMVSQQSQPINAQNNEDQDISEESFRQIVSYLFSFIKKDKQCETLIEKLTCNFKHANTERKCRDLAFCLTKININDSGIKKLFEMYKHYENKLCNESVCELFKQIIKNARKILTLRIETKKLVDDYEKKIEETLKKGLNEDNDEIDVPTQSNVTLARANVNSKKVNPGNNNNRKKVVQAARNSKKKHASSSSEVETNDDDDDDTIVAAPPPNKKKVLASRNNNKKIVVSSSSQDDSD